MTYRPPWLPDRRKRNRVIGEAMSYVLPPDRWLNALCTGIRIKTDADAVCVTLVSSDRSYVRAHSGGLQEYVNDEGVPLSSSFCAHVIAGGQPLIVPDTQKYKKLQGCVSTDAWRGWIGLPFAWHDIHIGALSVVTEQPREWDVGLLPYLQGEVALIEREIVERSKRDDR